ncbi:C40 family peptidase [Temperatibacter marinus]|uniref:C40 family peptidase n=1 Tax=Temperatibacter marinus TaxID=1456591 RepID=A0AA52EEH6_9PROT|nr:C40 family peptidase [Temperatibacter marinus]WND03316.1 C40 family peptidase [Temperatibacter marinus]
MMSMTSDLYFENSGTFIDSRLACPSDERRATVNVFAANLYESPQARERIETQLLYGETVAPVEVHGQYTKVISLTDGYKGWTETAFLCDQQVPNFFVSVPLAHLYGAPDLKTADPQHLSMGSLVTLNDHAMVNGFLQTEEGAYIYAKHVRPIGHWRADPVSVALEFLHAPYLWGGKTSSGLDCSALIQLSFAACGVKLHRDSDLQGEWSGHSVEHAARGDLAFFPGHVGMMLDEKLMLHANATHMKVTVDPLESVIDWVRREGHGTPFHGFKRI